MQDGPQVLPVAANRSGDSQLRQAEVPAPEHLLQGVVQSTHLGLELLSVPLKVPSRQLGVQAVPSR